MIEIIPALMPKHIYELEEKIPGIISVSQTIQIDVMDGLFVPNKSWPFNKGPFQDDASQAILDEKRGLPNWEQIDYEFDLMIQQPERFFENFIRMGASRIVFHASSFANKDSWKVFFEGIDPYYKEQCELGIAFKTTDVIADYADVLDDVAFVQCMGIEQIGFQGEPFDERVIEQIKAVRSMHPNLPISVDGGVNTQTARRLVEAGATRLVAGSAVWSAVSPHLGIEEIEASL